MIKILEFLDKLFLTCSHRSTIGTGNMGLTHMKRIQATVLLCTLLVMTVISFPLHALESAAARAHLGVSPNKNQAALMLSKAEIYEDSEVTAIGDTYSLAPLVQDSDTAFFPSDAGGPTLQTFDGANESGGTNLLGTKGGTFLVMERSVPMGGNVDRILVEVRAINASNGSEPWVDSSQAGKGFISWRLDVGSTSGGTNPIQPDAPFTLVDSGFSVFNSAGEPLGNFDLTDDTSTATSLSGVAALGNSGEDIAGVDVSAIQMYWDISSDLNFKNGFEQ
jgi:hypothetical protein